MCLPGTMPIELLQQIKEVRGASTSVLAMVNCEDDQKKLKCTSIGADYVLDKYHDFEAIAYLKTLHRPVKHLNICDGNMQEGSFRVDVNLSLKPKGSSTLGTRCEIKNVNSFKFIEKAIEYEANRQAELLMNGQKVIQNLGRYHLSVFKEIPVASKWYLFDVRLDRG